MEPITNGALTIAEADNQYKVDVSLAFGGNRIEKRMKTPWEIRP